LAPLRRAPLHWLGLHDFRWGFGRGNRNRSGTRPLNRVGRDRGSTEAAGRGRRPRISVHPGGPTSLAWSPPQLSGAVPLFVVDDNAGLLKSVARLLAHHDIDSRTFASAEALLESDSVQTATCLLLDIHLGGISGIELQRWLATSGDDGSSLRTRKVRWPWPCRSTRPPEHGRNTASSRAGAAAASGSGWAGLSGRANASSSAGWLKILRRMSRIRPSRLRRYATAADAA